MFDVNDNSMNGTCSLCECMVYSTRHEVKRKTYHDKFQI